MATPPAALSATGKAFFGSLCAGTFVLGCWQTQRLVEKQELMRQRNAELTMEPIQYASNRSRLSDKSNSFRRYIVNGKFHHEREFLVGPRGPPQGALPDAPGSSAKGMSSAPQGYFVVTPLEIVSEKINDTELTAKSRSSASWILGWRGNAESAETTGSSSVASAQDVKNYVLVNRGWVPRNMVTDDTRQRHMRSSGSMQPPRMQQHHSNSDLFQWGRPQGLVRVTGVLTETEHPKFLVADHELKARPPKLYWFDAPTMKAVARVPLEAPYFTEVRDSDFATEELPLTPTADKLGEFKVTPAVHAGYAVTWFGLSAAGMYMTRKLILRGR